MGNKKIIVRLLLICTFFCLSCKSHNTNHYFNEQGDLYVPINYAHVKLNLYREGSNNLYIKSPKEIATAVYYKNIGVILQDTIFFSGMELAGSLADIIDVDSYREIEKGRLYCDRNYIYYRYWPVFASYPFSILDEINVNDVVFLEGYYFKDNKHVYSYGGCGNQILDLADPLSFKVIRAQNTSGNWLYFGVDDYNIYYQEAIFNKKNLDYLDLAPLDKEIMLTQFKKLKDETSTSEAE